MATKLYAADWVAETVARIADEIVADRGPGTGRALIGLQTRGALLATRLGAELARRGHALPVGSIDATMYRDDLHTGAGLKPLKESEIAFDLNDRSIILVDDVMSTGRTIRAAMEAIFSFGRPACIRLAIMLDRGGKELPIRPDFTGARVDVPRGGFVRLKLSEIDPLGDAVYLVGAGEEEPA